MKTKWSPLTACPVLGTNEIHIWKIELSSYFGHIEQLVPLLSGEERSRAQRFGTQTLYNRFVVVRAKLREILGEYLNMSASALTFNYTANGKPFLNHNINFNISHSEDLAVFALCEEAEIGVDIEYKRPIEDLENICLRFLSARNCQEVLTCNESSRLAVFYDLWVKIEAYTKVLGEKLFDILAMLKEENKQAENPGEITLQSFYAHKEYASAFAVKGEVFSVKYLQKLGV